MKRFLRVLLCGLLMTALLLPVSAGEAQPPQWAVQPTLRWAGIFHGGIARVELASGRYAYLSLNRDGTVRTQETTRYAGDFNGDYAFIGRGDGKGSTMIDREMQPIRPLSLSHHAFSEGLVLVSKENGLFGYETPSGETVLPAIYVSASNFTEGMAAVRLEEDGLWGFINRRGELVIESSYVQVYPFSEGYAAVLREEDGLWGYIDKTGKTVIEPQFDSTFWFSEGYAVSSWEGGKGLVDPLGNLIPVETDDPKGFGDDFSCGLTVWSGTADGLRGAVDKTGKLVIPARFEILEPCSEGLLVGKSGDQYGIYDTAGNLVMEWELPTKEYDLPLRSASNNLLAAMVREKTSGSEEQARWGYIKNPLANPSSWAKAYIEDAFRQDLLPQRLAYDYQNPITREEYASLISRTLERLLVEETLPVSGADAFRDTASYGVRLLHALGVVEGTSEGTFGPDELLTREQASSILSRSAARLGLLASPRAEVPVYADHASISQGAIKSVEDVSVMGLMQGTERGFEPQAPFTREQAVTTALRLFALGDK